MVTVTAHSPDLSDTELAYPMLKLFTPQMGIAIEEENKRSHKRDQIITFIKDTKSHASCECFTLILHKHVLIRLHHVLQENNEHIVTSDGSRNIIFFKFNNK